VNPTTNSSTEGNDIVLVTSLDKILLNPAALTRETNSELSGSE
jgi:hypothetical protein